VDTNRALTRPTQAARTIITSNCMTTPTHWTWWGDCRSSVACVDVFLVQICRNQRCR
jgi:hypothetical protein